MHDAKTKFFKLHIWAQIHAKTKYNICKTAIHLHSHINSGNQSFTKLHFKY